MYKYCLFYKGLRKGNDVTGRAFGSFNEKLDSQERVEAAEALLLKEMKMETVVFTNFILLSQPNESRLESIKRRFSKALGFLKNN